MQNISNRIIKLSIYLLVLLLPLFWLPFSFEVFEFNKQYLLFFLVSLAFFCWIAKMVLVDKEIRFKRTPLNLFVLGFLFVAVLSAIFSVDKNSSLFGFYGRFNDGLIGLLSLGLFYFLITNNVSLSNRILPGDKNNEEKNNAEQKKASLITVNGLINLFLWSSLFVVLFSYLSIFGVWQRLMGPTGQIMGQIGFNPVAGSIEGLAIFLATVTVLLVGLMIVGRFGVFRGILLVATLGLLIIIDYALVWIILLVSLFISLILVLAKRMLRENINRLLLPIFLIIIAATFLFININVWPVNVLPRELILDQKISWKTAFGAATENIKSGFSGSGIGTFYYDFARHKPLEINQTRFWQIRFDRAGSHIAEILGTMGFLGILSYLLLIGMFFLIFGMIIHSKSKFSTSKDAFREDGGWIRIQLPIFMAFLALLISQFFYYQNTALAFTFWLMLGLAVVSWQSPAPSWGESEKVISFKDFPELSLIFSVLVIIFGLVILGFYYFGVRFYLADINYYQGLNASGQEKIEKLEKAVRLNPYFSQYRIALSRSFFFEAFQELQKPAEEQDITKTQTMINWAINEAKIATDLQPNSVATWENLGVIYREITGMAAGARDWSIKSFEKAIALEPTNPVLYTELGKIYFLEKDQQKAEECFQKALEKKPDYTDAIIQKALLLEEKGILDEAIAMLKDLISREPLNIEAHFQLGRLYYNAGQIDQSIEVFQTVISWVPNYSNALYSLGMAYSAKGQTQEAIQALEKVLELNPGNQDVIQKIEELKKSQSEQSEESEQPGETGQSEEWPGEADQSNQ